MSDTPKDNLRLIHGEQHERLSAATRNSKESRVYMFICITACLGQASFSFGSWQKSFDAGAFMFGFLMMMLLAVRYILEDDETGD